VARGNEDPAKNSSFGKLLLQGGRLPPAPLSPSHQSSTPFLAFLVSIQLTFFLSLHLPSLSFIYLFRRPSHSGIRAFPISPPPPHLSFSFKAIVKIWLRRRAPEEETVGKEELAAVGGGGHARRGGCREYKARCVVGWGGWLQQEC